MKSKRTHLRPWCEPLEARLVLSQAAAIGGTTALVTPVNADLNQDGTVDLGDLKIMSQAWLSRLGEPNYNPVADLNQDGKVNLSDAKLLEARLPRPPSVTPLTLKLTVAPGQEVPHPKPYNSGPIVRRTSDVTIIGRTIPGALVIADSSQGLYWFNGPLLPTDANGFFTYSVHLKDKLTASLSFLVIDQLGRQLIRNYPVFRV